MGLTQIEKAGAFSIRLSQALGALEEKIK